MKPILYSKVFWLNTITVIIAVVGVLAQADLLAEYAHELLLLNAVPNIILRTLTDQGVFVVRPRGARVYNDTEEQQ